MPTVRILVYIYTAVYDQTHPERVFRARLLDNQEKANAERYVCGKKSSGRDVSSADLFGTETSIPTVDISITITSMENRPTGVGLYRRRRR